MNLRDLETDRSRIVAAMRSLVVSAADKGDLDEAQQTTFDNMKTDMASLDKKIERQRFIDEVDRRADGNIITGTGDNRFDAEIRQFSLCKAILAQDPRLAGVVDASREREISTEIARREGRSPEGILVPLSVFLKPANRENRVITTTTPASHVGGNLVATDHMGGEFIDTLRANLVMAKLGARVLSGLVGNVEIPKRNSSVTAQWIAENSALTPSDQGFDKVTMTPKHVGALSEYSRNMLLQASPDIEQLTRDDMAAKLAEAMDMAALVGGGSHQPTGLLSTAGLDDSHDLTTPTWAKVLEMVATVQTANSEGTAWVMHPMTVKTLRSTPKVSGDGSAGFLMDTPSNLAGYNAFATSLLSVDTANQGPLVFGAWSDLLIGYWGALELASNPYADSVWTKGNTSVRALLTSDINVRHIESFVAARTV